MAFTILIIPLNRKRNRILRDKPLLPKPFVLDVYPPVNIIQKTFSSRFVLDFGGLIFNIDFYQKKYKLAKKPILDFGGLADNINKYKPCYKKCFIILESPVKNGGNK